jgi:hypothetical protein
MSQTYEHSFPGGYHCKLLVTHTVTEMEWTPRNPPVGCKFLREYRRWRNRSLKDYAQRTGVAHVIFFDDPHAGARIRQVFGVNEAAAYESAAAMREYVANGRTENAPGVRESLLRAIEQDMLIIAPRSVGGAA